MLSTSERDRAKEQFGADDAQIARDYLISHVLAVLSDELPQRVLFYGGTALSRSFLPNGRLSEDVDLISSGNRAEVARLVASSLRRRLAREFGRPTFTPLLEIARATQPVLVAFPNGASIQIQLLPADHYPPWPFESRSLEQRYSDAAPAVLQVPTLAAFVGWKTATFIDRRAARDLWDLAALAEAGAFSGEAADLFRRFGQFGALPSDTTLPPAPQEDVWQRDLGHQTRLRITALEARDSLVRAWRSTA